MIKYYAESKTCDKCGHTEYTSRNTISCDCCDKELKDDGGENNYIHSICFNKQHDTIDLHFCNWKCLKNYIPTYLKEHRENIDFVTLPYVTNNKIDDFIKNMIGE